MHLVKRNAVFVIKKNDSNYPINELRFLYLQRFGFYGMSLDKMLKMVYNILGNKETKNFIFVFEYTVNKTERTEKQ